MGKYFDMLETAIRDYNKLRERNQRPDTKGMRREPITEQQFVRMFGTKVKSVRYSRRLDFVGLILYGENTGIWITSDTKGIRRCRLINIINGKMHVTNRYIELKHEDSLCNLQKGLLRWIQ